LATIKRTAMNVNPMVTKKNKLKAKIAELNEEYSQLELMQEQYESSIRTLTGGYSTEDLVDKVVEPTNSVDKNGNVIKITKYVFKYPDTIIPPVENEKEDSTEYYNVIKEHEVEEGIENNENTESENSEENQETVNF
jgi:CHAT domain-containing protein